MSLNNILGMLVWTGAGAILLVILMFIDSLFTKYRDLEEMKNGNTAVGIRFTMKLFSQGYILSQSILHADDLWVALMYSLVSFVILLILEMITRLLLSKIFNLKLDDGVKEGNLSLAIFSGMIHVVGALILVACL